MGRTCLYILSTPAGHYTKRSPFLTGTYSRDVQENTVLFYFKRYVCVCVCARMGLCAHVLVNVYAVFVSLYF